MSQASIYIDNIHKSFSKGKIKALETIRAEIKPGTITGLVGPDGAGKTTLMRLIAGILIPDKGKISVLGYDSVKQSNDIHQNIGYMPQKFGLYEDLTILENMNLFADLRGLASSKRKETFEKLLEFTYLAPFISRLAGDLSGGMKQKLGLACALITKPRLLLLDEPGVGVDPISRMDLWNMVQNLISDDMAVIWSTSYLDEAEKCPTIILLNEGQVLFQGDPKTMIGKVKGRTYLIDGVKDKRIELSKIIQKSWIVDGSIVGRYIKILTSTKGDNPTKKTIRSKDPIKIDRVTPNFEDAFISKLGGLKTKKSPLGDFFHNIKIDRGNAIEAKNLTKKFGNFTAANNFNFTIKQGEIFGLLGPNGAGKSTTFKMMCGLLTPTSGTARVAGIDLQTSSSEARGSIGYMAQVFSLYGNLSVLQNLKFFSSLYGLGAEEQRHAIEEMIKVFDFGQTLHRPSSSLPPGHKQRLSLACSIMHKPSILFLDEPTSGVDPIARREFWMHINCLVSKGVTIMVTTHFMDEAEYCDRIAIVFRGESIAEGTPDQIKKSASSKNNPDPSMEDAFIKLVRKHE